MCVRPVKLPAFLPDDLRQLARFVPGRGWDAIEWKPMLKALRAVSWQTVSRRGVASLTRSVRQEVGDIEIVDSLGDAQRLDSIGRPAQRRRLGDDILRLYFAQWRIDAGLFMDLRTARFGVRDRALVYQPSGLWIRLRPEFRSGMLALYRSFYSSDEQAFDNALHEMGMLRPGLDASAQSELKALLHDHFGIDQSAQRFSIDRFKASFDELFAFFIAHDYKLHSDFVFVGFYLITLYLTLEQLGQAHDVRALCAQVLLDD